MLATARTLLRRQSARYVCRETATRQDQRHIQRLEELKLVKRKERYRGGLRTSNEYDLSGLVEKLKSTEPEIAKAKKLTDAAMKAGGLTAALAEFE